MVFVISNVYTLTKTSICLVNNDIYVPAVVWSSILGHDRCCNDRVECEFLLYFANVYLSSKLSHN